MQTALEKIAQQKADQKLSKGFWKSASAQQWKDRGSDWRYIRSSITTFVRSHFNVPFGEYLPVEVLMTLNRVEHIIRSKPAKARGRRVRRRNFCQRQGDMFERAG